MSTGIPILHQSHGIGTLAFGQDGTLLVSTGDSASYLEVDLGGQVWDGYVNQALADGIVTQRENVGAFRSQLVDSLCGKILRIDPTTGDGVPSNPWFDTANPRAAKSRVFALGLRNPYRMTMVPGTGDHDPVVANPGTLIVGDVGWVSWEEVSVVTDPGQNLGWPVFEGLELSPEYSASALANPRRHKHRLRAEPVPRSPAARFTIASALHPRLCRSSSGKCQRKQRTCRHKRVRLHWFRLP